MVGIGKESVKLGARIDTLQNSFDALKGNTSDSILSIETLRDAVQGTVSDVDLLTAANQALALGLPKNQLNDLFTAARKVGAAMGRTTLQSVQDLTTGIGRQSRLILDNLGIIVNTEQAYEDYAKAIGKSTDELTDNQRKTAFTNAAITQLNKKAKTLGDNISDITTANEKFNTSITNLKTEIGTFLIPIITDLSDQFTKDLLPSIMEIVELFRSRDFKAIESLIRSTFQRAIDKVVAFINSIDWHGIWFNIVSLATDVFEDVSGRVRTIIDNINWNEVWQSLLTFADNLWNKIKERNADWGDRFKKELLPQNEQEWKTIWTKLFDFAEVMWDNYFVPALGTLSELFKAWLPSNTSDWANIWIGLWTFAEELWDRFILSAGDLGEAFATFVSETNWSPLRKAFRDTIGVAVTDALFWGFDNFFEMFNLFGYLVQIVKDVVNEILGRGGGDGVLPPPSDSIPSPSIPNVPDLPIPSPPLPSDPIQPGNITNVSLSIGNFIGLDDESTRRNLRNALADVDVNELLKRGVRA